MHRFGLKSLTPTPQKKRARPKPSLVGLDFNLHTRVLRVCIRSSSRIGIRQSVDVFTLGRVSLDDL
jgi:hypothetical protein